MNYKFNRVDSTNKEFLELVRLLDAELAIYNGNQNGYYSQFNSVHYIKNAIVLTNENDLALACGAFKIYNENTVEVKRMYVRNEYRRYGLAASILNELESWAKELGIANVILETGDFLPGTIALYQKCGYLIIPNYDQYIGVAGSVCFKKELK